jgi:hypothetical protein
MSGPASANKRERHGTESSIIGAKKAIRILMSSRSRLLHHRRWNCGKQRADKTPFNQPMQQGLTRSASKPEFLHQHYARHRTGDKFLHLGAVEPAAGRLIPQSVTVGRASFCQLSAAVVISRFLQQLGGFIMTDAVKRLHFVPYTTNTFDVGLYLPMTCWSPRAASQSIRQPPVDL